jgi:hypothetical protein
MQRPPLEDLRDHRTADRVGHEPGLHLAVIALGLDGMGMALGDIVSSCTGPALARDLRAWSAGGVTCEFVTRHEALDGRREPHRGIRACALLVLATLVIMDHC